jgi:hypothetical protein
MKSVSVFVTKRQLMAINSSVEVRLGLTCRWQEEQTTALLCSFGSNVAAACMEILWHRNEVFLMEFFTETQISTVIVLLGNLMC